jgi:hypothetical protein
MCMLMMLSINMRYCMFVISSLKSFFSEIHFGVKRLRRMSFDNPLNLNEAEEKDWVVNVLYFRTASFFGFYKERNKEIKKEKLDKTFTQISYAEKLQERFKKNELTKVNEVISETLHLPSLKPSDQVLDKHCKKLTRTNHQNPKRDEFELSAKPRPLNPHCKYFDQDWMEWAHKTSRYKELRQKIDDLSIRNSAARNHWSLHKPINFFGHEIKDKKSGKTVLDVIRHGIYDISLQKYREDFIQLMRNEYQAGMVEKENRKPNEYKIWHDKNKYISKKLNRKLVEYGVLKQFYADKLPKTELATIISTLTHERDYVLRAQLASVLTFAIKRIVSNDNKRELAIERGRFLLVEWFLVSDRWKKESIMLSFLDIASEIASRAKIKWVDDDVSEGYSCKDENYICGPRPFVLKIKKPSNWNSSFPTSICHIALNTPVHWLDGPFGYLKSNKQDKKALKEINQLGIACLSIYTRTTNDDRLIDKIVRISQLILSSSRDKRIDAIASCYQLVQDIGGDFTIGCKSAKDRTSLVISHLVGRFIQKQKTNTNIQAKKTKLYHTVASEVLNGLGVDICEASTGKRKYSLDLWRVHLLSPYLKTLVTAVKKNSYLFFGTPFYRISKS